MSLGRGRYFILDTELSVDNAVDLMPGDSYDYVVVITLSIMAALFLDP